MWFFFLTVFHWLLLTLLFSSLHLLFYLWPSSPDKSQLPPSNKVSNHAGEQVGTVELSESILSNSFLPPSFPHTECPFLLPWESLSLKGVVSPSEVREDPVSTQYTRCHYIQSMHWGCFSFTVLSFAPLAHLRMVCFTKAAAFLPLALRMSPPFCLLLWSDTPMGYREFPSVFSQNEDTKSHWFHMCFLKLDLKMLLKVESMTSLQPNTSSVFL